MPSSPLEFFLFNWMVKYIPSYITPNQITLLGVVLGILQIIPAYFIRIGNNFLSLKIAFCALFISSIICDILDGEHARNSNQCSRVGAILDHFLDASFCFVKAFTCAYTIGVTSNLSFATIILAPAIGFNARLQYEFEFRKQGNPDSIGSILLACAIIIAIHILEFKEENINNTVLFVMSIGLFCDVYSQAETMNILKNTCKFSTIGAITTYLFLTGRFSECDFVVVEWLRQWNANAQLSLRFETKKWSYPGFAKENCLYVAFVLVLKMCCGSLGMYVGHFMMLAWILYSFNSIANISCDDILKSLEFNKTCARPEGEKQHKEQ